MGGVGGLAVVGDGQAAVAGVGDGDGDVLDVGVVGDALVLEAARGLLVVGRLGPLRAVGVLGVAGDDLADLVAEVLGRRAAQVVEVVGDGGEGLGLARGGRDGLGVLDAVAGELELEGPGAQVAAGGLLGGQDRLALGGVGVGDG